ncbi:heat shock 70 kDa protein 12A isoform X2 [Octopus bimaculoides]|uniref:heat shock 70 kDa protein 12A isoform X2 n=1 Tax=Octopus bimaculoides TaxID=37653 RepID=UPI0022DF24B9|nr:heat shock 70 kDa protein 12A isoform X2 [Octopus bimaculoides]
MEIDHREDHIVLKRAVKMNTNRGEYSDILRKKNDKETDGSSSDSDSSSDYGKRKSRVSYLGPIFLNRISSEIGNSEELNRLRTTGSPTLEQMVMCEIQNIGEKLDIKVHPWINSDNADSADNVDNANNNNNSSFCENGSTSSYTSSESSPTQQRDTQFKLSTDNNREQKQRLLHEYGIDLRGREVVLEANRSDFAPEVRNTLRVKQDTITREIHKKKSEDVYNIDDHRPDIKVDLTPNVENFPVYEYNLASEAHYTESKINTKKPKKLHESQVDKRNNGDNSGFSRKNVKNLSIEIMGVSTDSLEFQGETPLGDYYGQSSSDVTPKTTTIHRDYNDPNLSLVGSECPAISVLGDTGNYFVIVAIDFGTMFSGYAFSFTRDPESIHMMRKWEGGDPGINNQKAPTTILINPNGEFDSFGYAARDRYHDLDPEEAKEYMYFEKFKMTLHHNADLTKDTILDATNGKTMSALTVFSYALKFFKEHALQELSDQSGMEIVNDDVRWVITVPAIWKAPAKQFMRQASYQAGIASPSNPEQLIIALEPEAASIYCRKLRLYQLVPDTPTLHPLTSPNKKSPEVINMDIACSDLIPGMRYMVVDCGGGTVDITVHELESSGLLRELYKATGGAFGGTGIDMEFVHLLCNLFGKRFIDQFRSERPVGWMDMMIAFESRKRSASPYKSSPLNISLPFSFIDYYKKVKKSTVENAIKKYNNPNIRWSTQGMLRLSTEEMQRLFKPTLTRISEAIGNILNNPDARDLKYLFLVGGFAESHMLQHFIRREFGDILKVIIPQGVGMSILKGAVLYGQNPSVISVRRSRLTYGVGVLNRYDEKKHPKEKLFSKDGMDWCSDVFDKFVVINQPLKAGETVIRSYTPAKIDQKLSIINIYASDDEDVKFITDASVRKCGTLSLDLSTEVPITPSRREIKTIMSFGDTEIRMAAIDVITGKSVKAFIDFLD